GKGYTYKLLPYEISFKKTLIKSEEIYAYYQFTKCELSSNTLHHDCYDAKHNAYQKSIKQNN
ncbi:hypothetical protein, partial [Vibrio parahaemolyticus]